MMFILERRMYIFLVLIVSNAIISGSNGLFLPNSELIFKYNAVVKAGTLTPVHGSSEWTLSGTLKIQVHPGDAVFQFSNLSVSLFNGKHIEKSSPQLTFLPIPDEANELLKPFIAHYNEGIIKKMSVDAAEPAWSVNIKRAIASVFQLEESKFKTPSFISKEDSLYGFCDVEYVVSNLGNNTVVRKFIDHSTCLNYPRSEWKNTSPLLCPSGRKIITSTTGRLYVLVPVNNVLNLKNVEVHSGIDVQPFHTHGELNYAFVNQSVVLTSKGPISENISFSGDKKVVDLTYELPSQDLTQGRAPLSDQEYIKMVDNYFERIIENLETNPSLSELELTHDEHVPYLLHFLSLISRPYLEEYFNGLVIGTSYHQETKRNLFLKLLPQVGSKDAILLIQDIVYSRNEGSNIAIELLIDLPFYIRQPTEELLTLSEKLLTLNDNEEVQKSAVLTFSIMINKVCRINCRQETLEKYVRLFMDKFSNSQSYSEQVLFLEALNNIEIGNVFDYLMPVVRGNVSIFTKQPHHIRFLGVWASMSQAVFNPHKVSQLYWPILANRSEHLEMRVAALTMLIIAKPTLSNFANLLWFMQSEQNAHLLHFFYTTLESLIQTQYPCYAGLGTLASHIIRYVRPPTIRNWATGNYILDYSDPKYGFGGLAQVFAVANQRTGNLNVFYLLANSHALDLNLRQFAIYVKLEGLGDALKQTLFKREKVEVSDLFNIFREIKAPIVTSEPIHIEIIVKIEDRVVYCQYINEKDYYNISQTMGKLNFLTKKLSINYQTVKAPVLFEITQPTDLGVPLLLRRESAITISFRGNLTEVKDSFLSRKTEVDLRYKYNSGSSLIIYNPILNLWHATRRAVSSQGYVPYVQQISLNHKQEELKVTFANPSGKILGCVAHAHSTVSIYGKESKKLKHYCSSCKNSVVVAAKEKKNVIDVINVTIDDIGTAVQISIYDCDHSYSRHDFIRLIQNIFSMNNKNSRVLPVSRPFLGVIHSLDLMTLVPPPGSCGIRFIVSSSLKENTELILTGSLSNFETPKNRKKNLKIYVDLKSTSLKTSLKTLNILTSYLVQNDSTKYSLQMNITRSSEREALQKVCFDSETVFPKLTNGLRPWNPSDDVTSKVYIAWGNGNETCPKDGGEIRVTARGEVTKEQKNLISNSNSWPHAACSEDRKNVAEWGQGYTPITEACFRASAEVATLRKYSATLKFNNVSEAFLRLSERVIKIVDVLTPGLMPLTLNNLSNLTISMKIPVNKRDVILNVNSRELVLPKSVSWLEPFLVNTYFDIFISQAMKYGILGSCVVNAAKVISIDNKTHSFNASPCYTLVSGDCISHPHFAVFVKRVSESKPLAVKIHLIGNVIEILPISNGELQVLVNNEVFVASHHSDSKDFQIHQLEKGLVSVLSKKYSAFKWLQHNGHFLTLVVPALSKGELCGLCGDFNGDASNDVGEKLSNPC